MLTIEHPMTRPQLRTSPLRRLSLCLLAAALSVLLQPCASARPDAPVRIRVDDFPVTLDPEDPDRKNFDGLHFLAGFDLSSDDARFGGLSGLELSEDGSALYAVSDRGYWLTAGLRHDGQGRLVHIGPWEIAPLLTPQGGPVTRRLRDAEALVRDRDGSLIVAFERAHRLWRYPPPPKAFSSPPRSIPHPADLDGAPSNGGLEAVGLLADGGLLLLTEQYANDDGSLKGWLLRGKHSFPLSYLQSDGYRPTDLATLPNGDLLLLERRYRWPSWPTARLRRLRRSSVEPGARLRGEPIAEFGPPLQRDNFEGLAVREDPALGTFLYIVSDNNYNILQQTLLLQFLLNSSH